MGDFPGLIEQSKLVPLSKVDQLLTQPGSMFEIEHRQIRGVMTKVWKNAPPSLRQIWLFAAQTYASRPFIVAEGETHTYADVGKRVTLVSHWLSQEFGVQKGDRVAIVARNHVEFVVAFFAVCVVGAVPALVNAFLPASSIYDCIRDVGSKVALMDVERFRRLRKDTDHIAKLFGPSQGSVDDFGCTPGAHGGLSGVVVLPRSSQGIVPLSQREWSQSKAGAKVFDMEELDAKYFSQYSSSAPPSVQVEPEDLGCILYTSGTTGKPKGVCSTQRQFISCVFHVAYSPARSYVRRGMPIPVSDANTEPPSSIILVPLFHSTGIQAALVPYIVKGHKVALLPKYSVDSAAKLIQQHKIQIIIGIGFMIRELTNSKYKLDSVTSLSHGGSSSAKEIPQEVRAKHPSANISQGYGSTEVSGSATNFSVDDYVSRPTSAGLAPPTVDVMIIDPETCKEVPRGMSGEIWIRSPGLALGYWGRKKETRETFTQDGWYKSGDLGKLDKEGFLYVLDRSKHIIIRGGENISGTEVEAACYEDQRIIDCAAVPIPDERLGEKVTVVCVPRQENQNNNRPTEQDILNQTRRHLAKHAVPEFIWIRNQPLDRNANGKVDLAILKEAVKKRYALVQAAEIKTKL